MACRAISRAVPADSQDERHIAMISHVTIGSDDIARAKAFYAAVMVPLGYVRVHDGEDYFGYGETAGSPPCFSTTIS